MTTINQARAAYRPSPTARRYLRVVEYDFGACKRGDVLSRHSTYELAISATKAGPHPDKVRIEILG